MNACKNIEDINFVGNIHPGNWYLNLTLDDGKPNLNAITILGEIVYWYRLSKTGHKKFKYDKLQKQYIDFETKFGLTHKQVKPAIKYLVNKGIITIEFRTIVHKKKVYNNMMFIGLNIDALKLITNDIKCHSKDHHSSTQSTMTPPLKGNTPLYFKGHYTKTTEQKITNKRSQQQQENIMEENVIKEEDIIQSDTDIKEKEIENEVIDIETVKEVKKEIEKVTKSKINTNRILNLLEKHEIKKIKKYINSYHHFKCNKHNPVGFLIKAIENSYTIPEEEINHYQSSKPIQSTNFEQRVYEDDYFDDCYDNYRLFKERK